MVDGGETCGVGVAAVAVVVMGVRVVVVVGGAIPDCSKDGCFSELLFSSNAVSSFVYPSSYSLCHPW